MQTHREKNRTEQLSLFAAAASLIQPFAAEARAQCQVELQFHIKPKGEDGSAQVAELIRELQASGDPAVVGHLPKVRAALKAAMHMNPR